MLFEDSAKAMLTNYERDRLQLPSSSSLVSPPLAPLAPKEIDGKSGAEINASLSSGYRPALFTFLTSSLLLSGSACQAQLNLAYAAGTLDAANQFMGGTEMRSLVPHAGKLFAGNGYWEDQPGPEGYQNAQILVLSRAGGKWSVDTNFGPHALATSALSEVQFTTDEYGKRITPASILVASTWDTTGAVHVYTRNDTTNTWLNAQIDFNAPTARAWVKSEVLAPMSIRLPGSAMFLPEKTHMASSEGRTILFQDTSIGA